MAFKFRGKSSLPVTKQANIHNEFEEADISVLPKLTNTQLNQLTKVFPSWLRDNSGLKQLPGVYQGVLGQVQLQLGIEGQLANGQRSTSRQKQVDYMNRFTDTERVHQLLSASQLSDETLATIWAHVNKTFPGKLTNREVCLALALIAIFQRLEKENELTHEQNKDPFSLVKSEKKPPVPILYPCNRSNNRLSSKTQVVTQSKSIPDELNSSTLLVDIRDDDEMSKEERINLAGSYPFVSPLMSSIRRDRTLDFDNRSNANMKQVIQINNGTKSNSLSLIDMDGDRFEIKFHKLVQIWLRFLNAMKAVFKRSFDILNVENGRQSAIEALKSLHGKQFSKQLCLCYPLAHNIKFKIDELKSIQLSSIYDSNQSGLFDENYITQIDDLMTSINEYWAVLINLFHESGQTEFIELIMDGLNYKTPTVSSKTIGELANELYRAGHTDVCSICHTKFYLTNCDNSKKELSPDDAELVCHHELISHDGQYYYHAKCANFWLNQVDASCLPFHKSGDGILSPARAIFEI